MPGTDTVAIRELPNISQSHTNERSARRGVLFLRHTIYMSRSKTLRIATALIFLLIASFTASRTANLGTHNAISPAASSTASEVAAQGGRYPVVKVVDGDTITIDMNGKNTTVRLIGVDTPETVDPRKVVQCFGKEASDKTKQILTGQYVRLELDPSQGTLDKYGRTLAYVYAPSNSDPAGILVNKYLIAEGYGHEYTYDLPYKYQSEFKAAEKTAREQKKGLWADAACAAQSSRAK
ncbi:MAG: Micrococcal nuclease [Candidatus Kaiserbacteria bacterium]|nr:Micrococcal nuclease [Candidatus Kaiserbacteria bacterium]